MLDWTLLLQFLVEMWTALTKPVVLALKNDLAQKRKDLQFLSEPLSVACHFARSSTFKDES